MNKVANARITQEEIDECEGNNDGIGHRHYNEMNEFKDDKMMHAVEIRVAQNHKKIAKMLLNINKLNKNSKTMARI